MTPMARISLINSSTSTNLGFSVPSRETENQTTEVL